MAEKIIPQQQGVDHVKGDLVHCQNVRPICVGSLPCPCVVWIHQRSTMGTILWSCTIYDLQEHRRTVLCCWCLRDAGSRLPFCCTRHSAFLLALSGPCAERICRHPSLTETLVNVCVSHIEEPGIMCCSGQTSPDVCALKGQDAPWKLNTVRLCPHTSLLQCGWRPS